MLIVCASSTETQLGALGDLMTLLGATASSSGMDLALTQATAWVEREILNGPGEMRRQVYAETVAGSGSQRLMLSRTPVWAIQRMFDGTDTGQAAEYCSTALRIEDADAGFVELTNDAGFRRTDVIDWSLGAYPRPAARTRPWLVVYEAGWQYRPSTSTSRFATTSTDRTLPADVEQAVLAKAAELYQAGPFGGALSGLTVGPLTANFRTEGPDPVSRLLSPYRRLA